MAKGEWKPRRLDELGFLGRGKSRHRPRNEASLYGGPYPFSTADVMAADPYITSYSQTYSELGFEQSRMWRPGTLCMTIAGANTAKTAILKIEACFPDSIGGFIPDKSKPDLHFIKYSLDLMRNRFLAVSRGATQDNLGLDKILSFPIPAPDVEEQRRIGAILSTYDELIENSQRCIRILEAIARALYREWFVYFRFPGHENHPRVSSPLGDIPKGWQVTTLQAVTTKIGSGATPRGGKDSYNSEGIALIRSLNIYDYALVPSYLLPARVNQHVTIVRADPAKASPLYVLDAINSDNRKAQLLALAQAGATREALTKDTVGNFEIVLPPRRLTERYDSIARSIHKQREALLRQIQNLRRTRDLILPRLLSGQVDLETKAA